ncbi:alpha/beta fold hydrolase [Aeromicrobium sp. Leaf350]|uniref:alpha/beta fold hydrolase n=1 Tax=Aeromicrobium sp. Leaf350 TaxID=2876565 RepID=UPI001E5AEA9E|nr:alpha/beta hydrolase [Aeromicrobium sp. Leaf350]
MGTVTSADGSVISFDELGEGSPVVLLPGALCTRGVTRPLADLLAASHRVVNVDRRGRGDSTDDSGDPWSVERELEDVAAILAATGPAAVYGHSSGAGLAIRCVLAGLPITQLVVHDAPYNLDESQVLDSQHYRAGLLALLRAGRDAEAVAQFLSGVGVPPEQAAETGRHLASVAPTLAYDSAAMGDAQGGLAPLASLRSVAVPTTVLAGTAGAPFFVEVARQVVEAVPGAHLVLVEGHGHDAPADAVAPLVRDALERDLT